MPTFALTICVYTCPALNFIIPERFQSLKDGYWFCNIGCDLNVKIYCVDFFEKCASYFKHLSKNIIDIQTFSLWLYFLFVKLLNVYKL
jgi:hypothetical protein